ncbi:histone-lysine N-methyltransferase PRDM9-like isoform X2 [Saccostrea echinata]|uniref:histone-lysine N-methyltransferase PRDM9-like isoform X2 n=1 Tax=Saccostrea echinata TaxID=191078 RepID=UPI002A841755|nr:histone-lysine N-methyltransferase PRDM9-like isoform X2 [Saccostrea echinata]
MEFPSDDVIRELENREYSVEEYFSKAELAKLSNVELLRYKNMRKNYEIMLAVGLPAVMPEFMKGPRSRAKRKPKKVESDSDEEWTPYKSTREKKQTVRFSVPVKEQKEKRPRKIKTEKSIIETNKIEPRTYPLRVQERLNYMDVEVPDDDDFIYCEECNREHEGDCPVHGPLLVVSDTEQPQGIPDRAKKTLPIGLSVRESNIFNAGQGVFADKFFLKRTRFGPYEGEVTENQDEAQETGYAWQIYKKGQPSHFVNAFKEPCSNWMRYVNCARSEIEQNLVAFQYKGQIYYRSFKDISAGTELLVWYGHDYGKELGIFREHIDVTPKIVNGEELFCCPWCQMGFSSKEFMEKHCKYKHGYSLFKNIEPYTGPDDIFPCQYCKLCFSTSDFLKRHVLHCRKKGKENNVCSHLIRPLGFQVVRQVKRRFSDILTDTPVCKNITIADSISKPAYSEKKHIEEEAKIHVKLTRGDKPYKCDVCGRAFNQSQKLQGHMRTHTGDKPYKCDVCGKAFNRLGNLQRHMRTHTGDKPYKCDVCGKAFNRLGNLQRHMRTHTGDKPYKCDVCGRAFSQSSPLQSHMRTHTGDKPYKCDVCGKAFSQSSPLQSHMRTHTGDKPYKCDVCGKAFSQLGPLQSHMRTHTGDKPYKCDVCGKAFSQSSPLQSHMRTHTGDKPYKCDVCGKAFSQSSPLQRHMRTHTGDKPYKCDVCGKAFSQLGPLQSHMRTHTGDKPYKCDVCGKAFSDSSSFQKHKRTHTGDRFKCSVSGKLYGQSVIS